MRILVLTLSMIFISNGAFSSSKDPSLEEVPQELRNMLTSFADAGTLSRLACVSKSSRQTVRYIMFQQHPDDVKSSARWAQELVKIKIGSFFHYRAPAVEVESVAPAEPRGCFYSLRKRLCGRRVHPDG